MTVNIIKLIRMTDKSLLLFDELAKSPDGNQIILCTQNLGMHPGSVTMEPKLGFQALACIPNSGATSRSLDNRGWRDT